MQQEEPHKYPTGHKRHKHQQDKDTLETLENNQNYRLLLHFFPFMSTG
jgi:hypothetical protein